LKSKLLTFPGGWFSTSDEGERVRFGAYALYRRAAEAVTVRATATDLLEDGAGSGRSWCWAISMMSRRRRPLRSCTGPPGSEIGTGGFDRPDQGDGQRLWNLAARIPDPQRFSRVYRGRPELIDHILVSHRVVGAVADGGVSTGPAVGSITDDPNDRRDEPGSDHRPLVAAIGLT
jgi:hypothetical protein